MPLCLVLAFAAGCATFISAPSLESSPMPNMAITTMGVVWIGFMGSFAVLILNLSTNHASFNSFVAAGYESKHIGTDTLCLLAIGVVANDIGALFVGSAVGRTPLRNWISPNKTVEGFIGGTIFTLLALLVIGIADKSDTWNSTGDLLILGVVIAIAAPLGDLTESMFKRNLDIKDFGTIVRGHGGVLDRFDGFLFTLPAVYYLLVVLQPWLTK
jgi:phosphatidate cytidylyltransferase